MLQSCGLKLVYQSFRNPELRPSCLIFVNKLRAAKKRTIKSHLQSSTETWLFELFDISACKCKNSASLPMQFWNGKFACSCPFEHWIPAEEIDFLRDQSESRNMMLTSKVDIARRKQQEKTIAKMRKNEQPELLKKRREDLEQF